MEQKTPIVSIILPVFNGEHFLRGAIESVLNQTSPDWELFIIDDGSTDASATICDEYEARDSRIRVLHQLNGGVNSARSKGVDNAKGTYLAFLDADDQFVPDALEYLLENCLPETELLLAEARPEVTIDKETYLEDLWTGKVGPALWGKLFKASVYKQIHYELDRRIVMGEDLLLNSMYALEIDSARILPRRIYAVNRKNNTSVTRTFKHNWEYENYYFKKVNELFLSKCTGLEQYDQIKLLVGKSWLNAMKYVMLEGGYIPYDDPVFKGAQQYFKDKKKELGPSERLVLSLRNSTLYRLVIHIYLRLMKKGR